MSTLNKCETDKCSNEVSTWATGLCEPCGEAAVYQDHLERKLRDLNVVAFRCGHFKEDACDVTTCFGCWECTMGTSQCMDCTYNEEQELRFQAALPEDPWA